MVHAPRSPEIHPLTHKSINPGKTSGRADGLLDEALDLHGVLSSLGPRHFFVPGEEHEGRQRVDLESLRQHGEALGIDLGDDKFLGMGGGHAVYFGRHHFAWAAPIGPKIHQDRQA